MITLPLPEGLRPREICCTRDCLNWGLMQRAVHFDSAQEKEWYYKWFEPDVVVGVGYWGHTPQLVLHPQRYGIQAVPWLVADGYIANYQEVLNTPAANSCHIPTGSREMYVRDGIHGDRIEVLPVGCDTDSFIPFSKDDPKILAVREALGISPDELMILTVGGDAASKGAQEVMQALAIIDSKAPDWKYICKVWPQPRTLAQNLADLQMAANLGIQNKVRYETNTISRNFMPYLVGACDIYAAPSRLEGFGMPQVEAGACGKPVISIKAMGMLDTLIDGETALLAGVDKRIVVNEVILGVESGFEANHKVVFEVPRTVDYRANVKDIAGYLLQLMNDAALREKMGKAGRGKGRRQF